MMEPRELETARLMGRLKRLMNGRLQMAVNLETMLRDPLYASRVLAEVDARTRDVDLRKLTGQLLTRLLAGAMVHYLPAALSGMSADAGAEAPAKQGAAPR
jgi:hypothetical protein